YDGEYMITYNATAHPEFIKDNELLISYNVNGICKSFCDDPFSGRYDADLYRPKFVRVPLDYIDPNLNIPDPEIPSGPVTSIEEEKMKSVVVYPNPANAGVVTIDFSNFLEEQKVAMYRITNAYGQVVVQGNIDQPQKSMSFEKNGLYFLYTYGHSGHEITKIVVK